MRNTAHWCVYICPRRQNTFAHAHSAAVARLPLAFASSPDRVVFVEDFEKDFPAKRNATNKQGGVWECAIFQISVNKINLGQRRRTDYLSPICTRLARRALFVFDVHRGWSPEAQAPPLEKRRPLRTHLLRPHAALVLATRPKHRVIGNRAKKRQHRGFALKFWRPDFPQNAENYPYFHLNASILELFMV
jgi:hypothetical protein